jgi:cellulose synthase/poly-beta-1,6-N-acetylglucosamine synthase-like glycosyltransferase
MTEPIDESSAPATHPTVSFIVPVRNDAKRLRQCLQSIAAVRYPAGRTEVIVIDNGSIDDSAAVARAAGATTLEARGVGPASLRNLAARHATGTILAFVDADHEISSGWLDAAAAAFRLPGVAAVGALPEPPTDGTWVQRWYGVLRGRSLGRREVAWLGAGNLAVRSDIFAGLHGFDGSLDTCEDVDLCQRLRQAGYHILGDERLGSVHHGDPATLRDLFSGELWRGRDNLRVSLRDPSWRGLPSLLIPVVQAAVLSASALWLLVSPRANPMLPAAGIALFAGLVSARAFMLLTRLGRWTAGSALRALAVAAAYDLGRAGSLLVKVGYRRRHPARHVPVSDA